jgi:serine phosphatase RsbU (regulator of sigma subunit)
LVADPGYLSERVSCGPGDVFALVTDGLTETVNKRDEEFGLPRLEHRLLENAQRPLPQIFDALIAAVSAFGPQRDDRTILLVRILSSESGAASAS